MKKNLNKLATLALTGILMTGMSFGALADTVMSFDKVVTTDASNYTYAPATTFRFTIEPANAQADLTIQSYNSSGAQTMYAYAGVDDGVKFKNAEGDATADGQATFAASDDGTVEGNVRKYSKKVEFTVDKSKFTEPGVYHYTLKETVPVDAEKYAGVNYDDQDHELYVVLKQENGELVTDGVFITNTTIVNGVEVYTKTNCITNDYGSTANTTHDLTIAKKTTGALANTSREFTFKVKVTGAENEKYYVEKTTGGSTVKVNDLVSGEGNYTEYKIKSGDSIHIEGLTDDDKVEVYEVEANTEGYTTTFSNNGTDGEIVMEEKTVTIGDASLTGKEVLAKQDGKTVTVTNTKEGTTPTGVVMNIAPYAAMILGAGAFAGVFLGRKKSEDEE